MSVCKRASDSHEEVFKSSNLGCECIAFDKPSKLYGTLGELSGHT